MFHFVAKRMSRLVIFALLIFYVPGCDKSSPTQKYESPYPKAEEQNIDGAQLALAFANAQQIADLQGLAVARNFEIVAEEYFNDRGPGPDSLLHVMSVTKSIASTLIGIAIDEGFILNVEQKLNEFLGEEVDTVNAALGEVTLHQLMSMACGHDWHEIGSESEFNDFASAPDQLNYILQKPVVNTQGTVFNYSDGAAHLISVVISKATGMDASAFADQYLFGPLGLGERIWYTDNRGFCYGGVGLCIGIHDMIKIGYLYLNEGVFDGQRIVSSNWIQTATTSKISTNNSLPYLSNYGYYWWLGREYNHDFICAVGYGGQFILVVKKLNLVVAARCNYRSISQQKAGENWGNILNIIINQILPAVE